MAWLITVLSAMLLFSPQVFAAACPASSSAETTGADDGDNCTVTDGTTGTVIQLNFITGFNSATLIENDTVSPIATDTFYNNTYGLDPVRQPADIASDAAAQSIASGNKGTTVGAQRKLAFIKAAEILAAQITTTEPILVDADFTLLACSQLGATLGSASSTSFIQNASAPAGALNSTWYPVGLYNSLDGTDNYPLGGPLNANPNTVDNGGNINADSDIFARYNSSTGNTNCLDSSNGWYYGFDAPPSEVYTNSGGAFLTDGNGDPVQTTYIGFTTVLLHEMLHGMGFSTVTDSSGNELGGLNDIYATFLRDEANNRNWSNASESATDRYNSSISSTGLLWTGSNVNTAAIGVVTAGYQDNDSSSSFTSGDRVQMYAPNLFNSGSSVSHFDTAVAPNEIMEPQYTAGSLDLGLALYLLKDIGWTINAAGNTAPVLGSIGNKSAPVNTNLTVNLSATDAEGNALTYSGCDAELTCSISSNTLTLGSNTVGSFNITIEVEDDGSPNLTDSETFTFTTYAEPEIDINSTNLNPNDTLNISNSATSIDISNVNNAFSYSLEFEGSAANDLVSVNGTTLSIAMPTSGQFAGEYVLTFTDANTGTTYDFTLVRNPRLVFSATKLLANHSLQTLKIEGGAANTIYTLASSDSALSFRKNGTTITNVAADGNAASFYQASLVLVTSDVSASTAVTASVSSVYNTVNSSGLTVEPVRSHVLTFENSAGNALENVTATLDSSTLSAYNLASTYTSNAQGQVTIALPANTTDYTATTSLSGYSNATVTLDDSLLTQTVVLEGITDPMSLSGDINALGDLSFATELPVITLVLNDGSEVNITPTLSSNTLVTFSYVHNLATGSVSSLKVTHSQGIGIIFNINTTGNVTFDIFMESSTQTITNGTKKAGSSGGSIGAWALAILLAGLTRRRQIKPRC
ncbi:MAG: GlyGly-CTERM sorting domain-containing protein [Bermanella sp.]